MERLISILKDNKYQYFVKGIYQDGIFFEMPQHFKLNAVKVQTKQKFEKKLLKAFVPLNLKQIEKTKYEIIYEFITNDGVEDAWNVTYQSGVPVKLDIE